MAAKERRRIGTPHVRKAPVGRLRNIYGMKRTRHSLRRFEKTHGKGSIDTFKKIIEEPFSTLADVARHFGFSRENARIVYKEIYGIPYTELLQKKKEARRRRREELRQSRLFEAGSESKRLSTVIQAMTKARSLGFTPEIQPDGNSYLLCINGHKVAIRGASKAIQVGRKKYFHVGEKCKYRDFFMCICRDSANEAYYIIPGNVMPQKGTYIPLPNDQHTSMGNDESKYLQFREAWHLLAHNKDALRNGRKFCECGCGQVVRAGRRFILGHHRRGKILSEERKRKISEAKKGRHHSEEKTQNLRRLQADLFSRP